MATTKIKSTNIESGGIEHSNLANSGATAGTYGAAASIPVLTVTEKGIITAVSTVAVAGVSNFTYSSGDETLTISTADGNTYEADISGLASETYVDTAESDAVSTANSYTDGRETAITTAYQAYADQAELDAVSTANAYTDQEVAALVDSSPGTLDTLNELAAALGDDPNFASTVSANIGTRALKTTTVSAGTGLTGGGDLSANRTINLANTSVVAGSYGSSSQVPVITIDAQGRITAASSTTINATTLDGLDSTQFLRSDADDTITGSLTFDTDTGTKPIYITRSGNANESLKIHVDDNVSVFTMAQDESTNGGFVFKTDTNTTGAGFQIVNSDSTTLLYARSDGNVGIGTASPDYKLVIAQEDDVGPSIELHQASNKKAWINNAGPSGHGSGRANRFEVNGTNVGHIWLGSNRVTLGSSVGDGSETLTVLGSNVGIGTTTPENKLTVNDPLRNDAGTNSLGAAVIAGPISVPAHDFPSSTAIFRVQGTDATNNIQMGIGDGTYGYHGWIQASYDNAGGNNGAKHLLIQPLDGNVGIGTTNPSYKLHVNGTGYFEDLTVNDDLFFNGNQTSRIVGNGELEIFGSGTSTNIQIGTTTSPGSYPDSKVLFVTDGDGNEHFTVRNNGELQSDGVTFADDGYLKLSDNYPTIKPTLGICSLSKSVDSRLEFIRSQSGPTGSCLATYVGPDGLVHYAKPDEPRFTHDPLTGECLGLLMEKATTNYMTRTNFGDGWSSNIGGTTLDFDASITAPDGQAGCFKWNLGTGNGYHRLFRNVTVPSGTGTYAVSVWAKKLATVGQGRYFEIEVSGNFGNHCSVTFDLQDGVSQINTNNSNVTNVIMEDYGNGWYRCGFGLSNPASTGGTIWFGVPLSMGNDSVHVGDGGDAWAIWGPQFEDFTFGGGDGFVTSYIPVGDAAQTRGQDVININNLDGILNTGQFDHSVFIDFYNLKNPPYGQTNFGLWSVNGNGGNYCLIRLDNGGPGSITQQHYNGTAYVGSGGGSSVPGDRMRMASRFKGGDFRTAENGGLFGQNTGASNPNFSTWEVANIGGTGQYMGLGIIKTFQIYKDALTDDEMRLLTRVEKAV